MAIEDYFDPYSYDDREDDEPRVVECNRCGKGGLHWEDDNGKWRLFDSKDKAHICRNTTTADDFDIIK